MGIPPSHVLVMQEVHQDSLSNHNNNNNNDRNNHNNNGQTTALEHDMIQGRGREVARVNLFLHVKQWKRFTLSSLTANGRPRCEEGLSQVGQREGKVWGRAGERGRENKLPIERRQQ